MNFKENKNGVIKRNSPKAVGIFIDGVELDRATRRINKKIDMKALLKNLSLGLEPVVIRYYTLIPYEDDSRHRAYLDAIENAGFQVVVKRLPPKGVNRQVLVDTEMASDIVAFSFGYTNFSSINELDTKGEHSKREHSKGEYSKGEYSEGEPHKIIDPLHHSAHTNLQEHEKEHDSKSKLVLLDSSVKKVINLVCPSKELTYAISLANTQNTETITADFGTLKTNHDILKSASKWIDLSDSETIWRA